MLSGPTGPEVPGDHIYYTLCPHVTARAEHVIGTLWTPANIHTGMGDRYTISSKRFHLFSLFIIFKHLGKHSPSVIKPHILITQTQQLSRFCHSCFVYPCFFSPPSSSFVEYFKANLRCPVISALTYVSAYP